MKDTSMSNFHMVLCLGAYVVSAVIIAIWFWSRFKAKEKEAIRAITLRHNELRVDDLQKDVKFMREKTVELINENERLKIEISKLNRDVDNKNKCMLEDKKTYDALLKEIKEYFLKELNDRDFAISNLTGRLKEANEKLKEQTIDNRATALRWAVEFCKVSGMDVVTVAKAYYRFIQGKA